MFELIQQLTNVYGAAGRETAVADLIESLLKDKVDSIRRDAMGNLICEKKGTDPNGKRIMLSAHMDHIGLMVMDADKHGYLRVTNVGGIRAANMVAQHVVFENGVVGVVGADEGVKGALEVKHLYIDVGAESREEALALVPIGEIAVMAPRVAKLGENRLASPAMDDRIACYIQAKVLLELPEEMHNEIVAVFSVQEEVGLRGAITAAYRAEPDLGIALDVTGVGDVPGHKDHVPMKLGAGCTVKIMDRSAICTPAVVDMMLKAAEENDITVQREVLPYGGTDGGAIQKSRCGVPTGVISIPCRYVHSAAETVDLRDVKAACRLLRACVLHSI